MPISLFARLLILSGLLHTYIGWRLLPDLPLGPAGIALGVGWLALSTLLTPAPLLALRLGHRRWSDALAWLGYLCMGFFSCVFVLTVLRDCILLGAAALDAMAPGAVAMLVLARTSAAAAVAGAAVITLAGLINARRLAGVVEVEVPIAGLPAALHGFTIVQISDIHVGPTIKRGYLDAVVAAVNRLRPDLVAVTGDIVDGGVDRLRNHVAPLAGLSARHGVYCVTGNHEYYSGVDDWVRELRRLGLRVMMNEGQVLQHDGAELLLGGITDFSAHHFHPSHRSDPHAAARGATRDTALRVLLAHQPRSAAAAADAGFDLQLSGHTHGGQFLPWNFFVRLQQPFTAGLHRLKNLWVYTSRGTGYWGPPLRFCAPSEITRLRLVTQDA
jgi:predicted MPP superfamily phosphohydrolase